MALGDDEVIPCGCGFDDVSYPHDCFPEKKKIMFEKQLLLKQLHEIVGMAHAGGLVSEENHIEELFFKIETDLDSIIEGLEKGDPQ